MEGEHNPAGRLHRVLEKAHKTDPKTLMLKMWADICGCEQNDAVEVFRFRLQLMAALDDVERAIDKLEVPHKLLQKRFPNIRKALSHPNLGQQWSACASFVSEAALSDLAYCAHHIASHGGEDPIPEDELKDIREEISKVFDLIVESEVDDILRETLLDLCEGMRRAVSEYEIRGVVNIRKAVSTSIGELARFRDKLENNKDAPVVKGFWWLLLKVDNAVSKAGNLVALVGGVKTLLLP